MANIAIMPNSVPEKKGDMTEFVVLSGEYHYPNIQLHWVVKNVNTDGVFLIEEKVDDVYSPIGLQKVECIEIAELQHFSHNIDDTSFNKGIFRIRYINKTNHWIDGPDFTVMLK